MATCVSSSEQEKKKKPRTEENKSEHRKRKREDDKKSRRRKSSKSERGGGGPAGKEKKVRTISELVKLVISGEVKVPKTLLHYAEDRDQLLEQVFTILSENDVRGMLPDILKGLKLRQVRQLCLEQLKAMSQEDIMDCIEPQSSSSVLNVDATVLQLLGNTETTGGGEEHQLTDSVVSPTTTVTGTQEGGGRSNAAPNTTAIGSTAPRAEVESIEEGEKEAQVTIMQETRGKSDVGDAGVEIAKQVLEFSPVSREESPSTQTMECDTTTSDISREDGKSTGRGEGKEEEEEGESEGEYYSSEEEDASSESDLDDIWLCDFPEEVSEWARIREIEFRQRALEAELRRRGEKGEVGREGGEEGRGEEEEEDSQGVKVDKSKAIELQMRQRALQSLLAKKKEQQQQ